MKFIEKMLCKHKWILLSEKIILSSFERAMECIRKTGMEDVKLSKELSDNVQTYIQTFTCEKCGKLKRFVDCV